jgi:hypothetical protein
VALYEESNPAIASTNIRAVDEYTSFGPGEVENLVWLIGKDQFEC